MKIERDMQSGTYSASHRYKYAIGYPTARKAVLAIQEMTRNQWRKSTQKRRAPRWERDGKTELDTTSG